MLEVLVLLGAKARGLLLGCNVVESFWVFVGLLWDFCYVGSLWVFFFCLFLVFFVFALFCILPVCLGALTLFYKISLLAYKKKKNK